MWRAWPSLRVIVGRVSWKSKYSSGSTLAISSASNPDASAASAVEAAPAASFQPLKLQTRIGERSVGTSVSQLSDSIFSLALHGLRLPMGLRLAARLGLRLRLLTGRQRAANEREGDEQGQRGEAEFERSLRDRVGDDDADHHPDR